MSRLAAEGIFAYVRPESSLGLPTALHGPLRGIGFSVVVRGEDLERALEVFADVPRAAPVVTHEHRRARPELLLALPALAFGILLWVLYSLRQP